uniref:Uncharacterized protein n=1 Tax=Myotis myotis TaxID=51298 RepID=A0A7J7R4G0_MYOMY|nr:hypothetical protein mMyoMyo1_020915 [Myotis myotis]
MPSLRTRPEEAEMEHSVPGPSPWTPSAQACVSDATTATHTASAFCDPLYCSDTELGTTPLTISSQIGTPGLRARSFFRRKMFLRI